MQIKELKDSLSRKLKADYSEVFIPVAVLWFAIRVVPKPSRISYPCQRATLSLAVVKLGVVFSGLVTATTSLVNRKSVKVFSVAVLIGVMLWDPLILAYYQYSYASSNVQLLTINDLSYGFPSSRVVQVHSATATNWDYGTGYYWQYVNQTIVDHMVEEGVKALTSSPTAQAAWQTILSDYASGDVVGIKINGNDFQPFYAASEGAINTLPQTINAVIAGLKSVNVPESDIWVIEPTGGGGRQFYEYYSDGIQGLYPQVQLLDRFDIAFGNNPELLVDFPYTNSRYITDQMADIDHLIIIPIMKAITPAWGLTGTIKMMQGNIQDQGGLHSYLTRTDAQNPDVLIYQNQHIIGKTKLIVGDGLFGTWTGIHFDEGSYGGRDILVGRSADEIPRRWITFDNGAPNLLFFGVDPVAIDSVMYDHVFRERNAQDQVDGQTLAPFNEPQLIAGEAAGLGVREHGPPYQNIDHVTTELGEEPPSGHDVAVIEVTSWPTSVVAGQLVYVNVTLANEGDNDETLDVTAYYDQSEIETQTGISISAGSTQGLSFTWNTTGVAKGTYNVRAEASTVPGEIDIGDNSYVNGAVTIGDAVHDVAITSVSVSQITAYPGELINVSVVAANEGTYAEAFTITAYANATVIGSSAVTLPAGSNAAETLSWNTTGAIGVYQIRAEASVVEGEIDAADNVRIFDGAVAVFPHPVEFPKASFTYLPTTPSADETVTFNASASSDPDGSIVKYSWNFGDGTQMTEIGPVGTHAYSTEGNYTVTLTITDDDGLFDTATHHVLVEEKGQPTFPTELVIAAAIIGIVVLIAIVTFLHARSKPLPSP